MGIIKMEGHVIPRKFEGMIQTLIREMKSSSHLGANPGVDYPVIIAKESVFHQEPPLLITHLYVIWDSWLNVSKIERSEIITEAFYDFDETRASTLQLAVGLTRTEADELQVQYKTID